MQLKIEEVPMILNLEIDLWTLTEENNIDYVVDLYNFYSSDATHAAQQGQDVNFASLGPAVDASHHYERTHIDSVMNTTKLLIKYLLGE